MPTKVIDNFTGALTLYQNGDMNSGRSLISVSAGQNPFVAPGQLTWAESPTRIDPNSSVVTDLIMAGKERVESGILYVYAIGHTGRLYKIQVNDPSSYNPDYDNPVLLATLSTNLPTFTRGGFIDFYGATEKIYIGHDKGVTSINFNGSGETFVGVLGSWTQTVPRPLKQFLGNLYVGNGSNIAQIDTTATVTTYAKLSPAFPTNSQVRDIDVSPDGIYLVMVVSRLALYDLTATTQDTTSTANSESFLFKWNGTDMGYTAFTSFPTFSLTANTMFQDYQYTFGQDQFGMAIYNPSKKIIGIPESPGVNPNAISSTGNLLGWMSPLYFDGFLEADFYCWGSLDFEVGTPLGYWDLFFVSGNNDIIQVPFQMSVSNTGLGASSNGYANNLYGTSKIYFSTLEYSPITGTTYKLYKWRPVISPQINPSSNILLDAVYQTQSEIFPKKIKVSEVRVYGNPWVADNSFQIEIIGPTSLGGNEGNPRTFTASATPALGAMVIGDDTVVYNFVSEPTYTMGLKITNKGPTNHVINKVEIDYTEWGSN